MNLRFCVMDYETRSKCDLKKSGSFEYARHPSTRILCVAWRIGTFEELKNGTTKTEVWSPALQSPYGSLKRALLDPSIILVAHNAPFEKVITKFVLSKLIHDPYMVEIEDDRWICTMSMGRALALPGRLEHACAAIRHPVGKDMEGHRLMLKMSKPRKPTKNNPAVWHQKKTDLARLMRYCATDVDAEVALFTSIPPLSENERKVWLLDQRINRRGFRCDRELVKKILGMIRVEARRFETAAREITGGEVESTNQVAAIRKWLKKNGIELPNLQAKTVSDFLAATESDDPGVELLRVRAEAAKSSTAKYEAFFFRSGTDDRVRDNLEYHVASTGRWGGRGVQPQNFPRPTKAFEVFDMDRIAALISDPATDLELIRLLFGNPMELFANLLRSMIISSEGKEFFGGDFAGIEVRVLFWVAKHTEGLRAFIEGRDLYCEQATDIYGKPINKKDHPFERQLGKKTVLGAGFGLGKDKFLESCEKDGIKISEELAAKAISAYRKTHYPVPRLWRNLERAAIAATMNPGKRYSINRTTWFIEGKYLFCELPSKRRLAYYGPEVRWIKNRFGQKQASLHHWDVHPKTKRWVFTRTWGGTLTENVVQAIARDFMVSAMFRIEAKKYDIVLSVHDEILAEIEKTVGSIKEFADLMSVIPEWGKDCPINVEAWSGERYRK